MMPLTMAKTGEANEIKKVGGKEDTRRFLESLGFVGHHCFRDQRKSDCEREGVKSCDQP